MTQPPLLPAAHLRRLSVALLCCLLCAGSIAQDNPLAPDRSARADAERKLSEFAASTWLGQLRRTEQLSLRLLRAATPYCGSNVQDSLGVVARRVDELPADLRLALGHLFSQGSEHPVLLSVPDGSPAARQGLRPGDAILQARDSAIGNRPTRLSWALPREARPGAIVGTLSIRINRAGAQQELSAMPELLCNQTPELLRQDAPLVSANGRQLRLSSGALRLIPSDDQLALLLASRLALSLLPADTPAALRTSQADYLAAYLLARAGYDLLRAQPVWQTLALTPRPAELAPLLPEHDITPERLARLTLSIEEIRNKQQRGIPLLPERRLLPTLHDTQAALPPQAPMAEADSASAPRTADARLYDITQIPFVRSDGIVGYRRFLGLHLRPRAFAISSSGAWSYKSGANAVADALTHCRVIAKGRECYLYAVDNQVVWNPDTARATPEPPVEALSLSGLQTPPPSGFADIRDLAALPANTKGQSSYRAFLEMPLPRAFILTQDGEGRYWLGPGAMEHALAWCERLGEPCWLYAVDNTVVWHAERAARISRRQQLRASPTESLFLDPPR